MLGFDVRVFGKNTVAIEGIPADILSEDAEILIQKILEQYKNNTADLKIDKRDNLARSLAKNTSIKRGTAMKAEEMSVLIDQLFACNMPYYNADGQPTLTTLSLEELNHKFRN
jgi:DNA mismatch repair protein MutL